MVSEPLFEHGISLIIRYRVHILVFFLTLFLGLTITHPVQELNDEWITLNQLNQLHANHQVILNEGKYGLFENGSISPYFQARSNVLGYSIALPLLSLPAFWLIDITANHFPFLVLYLWTIVGISLLVFLNFFFREYTFIGKWRWTTPLFIIIFTLFFINLYYYASFPVGPDNFPEVLAIVFTQCFLVALTAVMIYEINYSLFVDSIYSFFGTVTVLSCSSYFMWMIGCKDHILTVFIFTAVLLWVIKYLKTGDCWYLALSFISAGLLSWVRPELAFWVFLGLCLYCAIIINHLRKQSGPRRTLFIVVCAPFFTLIGALPFFTNNYMITKNIFIPASIAMFQENPVPAENIVPAAQLASFGNGSTFHSVSGLLGKMIQINPDTFISDLLGVLFSPQNGGIGVFPLVPLFLVMGIVVIILLLAKKIKFTDDEWNILVPLALLALSVFIAYGLEMHSLNISKGVLPDMRYLSPMYIPLTLIGLFFLKKINLPIMSSFTALKWMAVFWIFTIPVSLIIIYLQSYDFHTRSEFVVPLDLSFSIIIFAMSFITLLIVLLQSFSIIKFRASDYFIPLLCALPLVWQIDIVFFIRSNTSGAGYTFWIPIVRILYDYALAPLLIH